MFKRSTGQACRSISCSYKVIISMTLSILSQRYSAIDIGHQNRQVGAK